MHELSLCSELASAAARAARSSRVLAVYVDVGALRQVVPDAMEFVWPFVVHGTPLDSASLHVRQVPATLACDDCGAGAQLGPELGFACRACGSQATHLTGGRELVLTAIDVAVDVDDTVPAEARGAADDRAAARRGDRDGAVPPSR